MILYVDSSALMRRYLNRPGREEMGSRLSESELVATATLPQVEVAASLTRLAKGGVITLRDAAHAIHRLEQDRDAMWLIPINSVVVGRAYHLGQQYGLKGYDAVHLAAATTVRAVVGQSVELATFDAQLWAAGAVEGLEVWPPDLSAFQ